MATGLATVRSATAEDWSRAESLARVASDPAAAAATLKRLQAAATDLDRKAEAVRIAEAAVAAERAALAARETVVNAQWQDLEAFRANVEALKRERPDWFSRA